jgi:hypothetical protein
VGRVGEKRLEVLQEEDDTEGENFYVTVRGGAWTLAHRGEVYDSFAAQARAGDARYFCRTYGLNVVVTFSVARYGDLSASLLAHEWCRRLEYFFGLWMAQDDWLYRFTDADVSSYHPKDEFVDFFLGLPLDSPTMARASEVNNIRPKEPRAID